MGLRRAGAALSLLVIGAALLPTLTYAQTAEEERDRAYSLLSEAVANQDQVEQRLAVALEDYRRITNEFATKAAAADRLASLVAAARADLEAVDRLAGEQAVAAYIEAVVNPSGVVLRSQSLEQALVLRRTIDYLATDTASLATRLELTARDLAALETRLEAEVAAAEAMRHEAQAAAENLQALFAIADAELGLAIESAIAADVAYRAELDRIETAAAEAAEQARQEERGTTTTSNPISSSSTTASPTSPSNTLPPPPSIGDEPLKPAVERWRPTVASYFPSNLVDPALRIIQCESLGDPDAYNPYSGASGLFQFLPGTWAVIAPKAGYEGASPFEAEPNIATAAWLAAYYQSLGRSPWTPWYCTP